jgi:hypothetical protein
MGYAATAATLVAIVSGLVLTADALWGRRISYAWDRAHLVSTLALLAFAAPHVGVVAWCDRAAAIRLGLEALCRAESQICVAGRSPRRCYSPPSALARAARRADATRSARPT